MTPTIKLTPEQHLRLKNKQAVLQHDSDVDSLNTILISLFPRSDLATGTNLYYYAAQSGSLYWTCSDVLRDIWTEIEYIRVSDVIEPIEKNHDIWFI